ncbi:MAG: hypothetical protein LRZ94_01315 [Candidatus Pacebacteria bacterium]|nr:hypothetical protein [Candidatus Paceibacterota bacterium]
MSNIKRTLYNCAINGQGYILHGIPERPARRMTEARPIGAEPRQFDIEYHDASSFFPWVQTDWAGGFQEEKWKDQATFKSAFGLEFIKKYGQLTLLNNHSLVKDVGAGYTFGSHLIYNKELLIGCNHGTTAILGRLTSADVWTTLTTGWTSITQVNSQEELQGKAYLALKRSTGTEKCLQSWDGSAFVDATGNAAASSEWRMVKRIEKRLYASNFKSTADGDRLLFSDDGGTTWTEIITKTGKNRKITQGVDSLGTLYFLIEDFPRTELWWCNDTIIIQIYRWENLTNPRIMSWLGRVYVEGKEDGKLRRFEWNGAVLRNIFEERIDGLDVDTSPMIIYKNNLLSYGLIFDRTFHFPSYTFKYAANKVYPFEVFGGADSQVPYFYGIDGTSLKISKLASTYLTTGNVVTGIYNAGKPAVTKLWHSITLSFKELVTGQTIKAEYSTDDEATWAEIGTISPVVGETEKTLYFAVDTSTKRIQLRLTLTGDGTNTPTLYDFIVRFLHLPDDKFQWTLTLLCQDNLILLDGKTRESKRADELRNLLQIAQVQNKIVEFQDVDFAETLLNGALTATATTITVNSTNKFPEQGRIKIGQEEMLYTGKTATAFTGCTRGARGTVKSSHLDNAIVSNKYNVIITSLAEVNPVAPKPQTTESLVSVRIIEV